MIARHDGEVLLVAGAIPGERVAALVTRAEKRVAFADTVRVIEGSSDRRQPLGDSGCGGSLYSHIAYTRQVQLKGEIIRDAYIRIGRIPVEGEIEVTPSIERGYRMRARFHVRDGRPGFYREGTRELCDARQTAQVLDASIDAVEEAVAALQAQGIATIAVELSENMEPVIESLDRIDDVTESVESLVDSVEPFQGAAARVGRIADRFSRRGDDDRD